VFNLTVVVVFGVNVNWVIKWVIKDDIGDRIRVIRLS